MALSRPFQLFLLVCAYACTVLPSAAHAEVRVAFGYTDFFNRAILELNGPGVQVATGREAEVLIGAIG